MMQRLSPACCRDCAINLQPESFVLILHAANTNKNAFKSLIAAEYSGVKVELNPNFEMGVTNKTPEFLKIHPIGKANGLASPIKASNTKSVILLVTRLKADNPLYGSSLIDYGHIEQWLDFASLEIDANTVFWFKPRDGRAVYLSSEDSGEVKQTESVPPVTSIKKPSHPKESTKPKPKDEPKKEAEKEELTKPKPEAAEEEWKRLYLRILLIFCPQGSGTCTILRVTLSWFCDYKYNEENTVSYVTLNKVGGFLQRMDLARKYAFGKMLVIGSEAPFKVKGLWLFRGPEIPQFVLDECYDMELFEWKKVDITDEDQKERVNQMIEDFEPFEGEPLLDAKCFK
uniref:EF-1-gamma C-terminal domain-containing protein n=1 Tax=Fagus sylvatica TaxID=28930 RepID=A0A2N9EYY6_FAGSY